MAQTFTSFTDFKRRYPIRPNDAGMLLGSGSYGRVIKVEDQVDTDWVAIKISEFKGNDPKSLKAEVELARRIPPHTNIARYDACYRLETDTSVSDFAIMKYYPDGNLADLLRHITLTPTQIDELTRGILLGLRHLHQQRIVHRDFKPANILISRDFAGRFIPKIADFGLSKLVVDEELDGSDFDLSDGRGTPSYKAPEQIEGSQVSFNLDLWAFGVILYEMMTGEKPFRADQRNSSDQSARREIEKKIVTVDLPKQIEEIAEPYRSLIRRCLVRDIHKRARREDELLDLLDRIPQLLTEASQLLANKQHDDALGVYSRVLDKRENQAEALRGVEQCSAAIEKQRITQILRDADALLSQQPDQAERLYAEVLRLDPTNAVAANGQRRCVEQRRTKPRAEDEPTDVYQEEGTDVFVPPAVPVKSPQPPVDKQTPVVPLPAKTPARSDVSTAKPVPVAPVPAPFTRPFPWRIIAPVAAGLGGLILYLNLSGGAPPAKTASKDVRDSVDTANVALGIVPAPTEPLGVLKSTEATAPKVDAKAAMTKRVDVAFEKAKIAFRQKDYQQAVLLTSSALGLDATRQDVRRLRDAATTEATKTTSNGAAVVAPAANAPAPVVDKPKAVELDAKPTVSAKDDAQEKYNQLMDDGLNAIKKSNNKAKARADFLAARSLAKEHDLNTAKTDNAYQYAIGKAQGFFDRNTFDGAKDWYLVAQSLKDTDEVRRKINQCTNLIP